MIISRTFKRDYSLIGYRAIDHSEWLTICKHTLNKFWEIDNAEMIEVVLTDKPVEESLKVSRNGYYTLINGCKVIRTEAQIKFLRDFFPGRREFYMYVYILEEE